MAHITLLALPNALAGSLTLPLEMLNAGASLARSQRRDIDVQWQMAGLDDTPVRTASGLKLQPDLRAQAIASTDLLLVPTLWRNPLGTLRRSQPLIPWMRELYAQGTRICTAGTGSYLLAEAGLLDGRPATTHWHYFDDFAARYPRVQLKRDYLITEADNLYCAGSINAFSDLMVYMNELLFGHEIAARVAAQFSPEIRRPIELQRFRASLTDLHRDELVVEAQGWLRDHLADTVSIASLAQRLDISERSLDRRFQRAIGMTPLAYLQHCRMQQARELLRFSNLAIGEIAAQVGYSSAAHFSRLFRRAQAQSPVEYRRAVRGKLFGL